MYENEYEVGEGLKTKDRKGKREKLIYDWVMVVGVVGFDLISVRKKREII